MLTEMTISGADATIIAGVIGGGFGLLGVCLGSYLSRREHEKSRQAAKLFAVYREIEVLRNCLIAVQKQMIEKARFYRLWTQSTERIMEILIGSALTSGEKKRILKAINAKWDDPQGVTILGELAGQLLEECDPGYALAAKEMLRELGIDQKDVDPIILRRDS